MIAIVRNFLRDPFKRMLFEVGAGYYARKLACGPEADIRREFVNSLRLPPSGNGHGTLRVLDVGCGPGHVARELAQSGHEVTAVDRSRSLLRIARRLARREGAGGAISSFVRGGNSVCGRVIRLLLRRRECLLGGESGSDAARNGAGDARGGDGGVAGPACVHVYFAGLGPRSR